jgi:hypothetical protein
MEFKYFLSDIQISTALFLIKVACFLKFWGCEQVSAFIVPISDYLYEKSCYNLGMTVEEMQQEINDMMENEDMLE